MSVLSDVKKVQEILLKDVSVPIPGDGDDKVLAELHETAIINLLTAVQHYCAQNKLDFVDLHRQAFGHFEQESRRDLQWSDNGPDGKEMTILKGCRIISDEESGTFEVRSYNGGYIATTADLPTALLVAENEHKKGKEDV